MEVIEKEQFAFDLLNRLYDEFDLHDDDYTRLVQQIWVADTHYAIDGLIRFLQSSLLTLMYDMMNAELMGLALQLTKVGLDKKTLDIARCWRTTG